VQAYRVALHPRTLALLAGPGGERLAALEELTRRRFFLVPAEGHVHADHFEELAEGRRDDLAPAAPVAEGAEVEVKLVEVDLHDASAAVGRADGFPIVVADAAKRVGKKTTVSVGRVLEGQAFATLVGGEAPAAPITFESEAEKPTRAPSRRRAGETKAAPVDEGTAAGEPEDAVDAIEPADEPEVEAPESPADGAATPAKKRTRRGSRGGKRRKKAPAATAPGDESVEGEADLDAAPGAGHLTESEPEPEPTAKTTTAKAPAAPRPPRRRTPRIHVPDAPAEEVDAEAPSEEPDAASSNGEPEEAASAAPADAAPDTGAPPKKRTRRGSRGGRNRKRKTPVGTEGGEEGAVVTAEPEPSSPAEASAPAEREDGYVPMSEWIDELES
jgi:predicted RNA-binding protein with TRAM domain